MTETKTYDCAIIGGGMAGLCLSIQLARLGWSVVVFEKSTYPFHKVCGEYVSNECVGFLLRLGLRLDEWDLPQISKLAISSEEGYKFSAGLGLGGFGISRYKLDSELLSLALQAGVTVKDNTKVQSVKGNNIVTANGEYTSSITVGAFGKNTPFFAKEQKQKEATDNYVGVKYHIRSNLPGDTIALHNFKRGYCGVSRIEGDRYCLCYLSHTSNLLKHRNNIAEMETQVVTRNPHLKEIFHNSEFIFDRPLTISNIRFTAKNTSDSNLIYLGDAAGCISPLTGNGMSMSAYASFVLGGLLNRFLAGELTRSELEKSYKQSWHNAFSARIRRGQQLQYLFGKPYLSHLALRVLQPLGKVKNKLIASTHGVPF